MAGLLAMWERGRRLAPSGRSRAMLQMLGFEDPEVGRLTVGQRDSVLMDMRARVFGGSVASVADCPACSNRMDITFDLQDVRTSLLGDPASTVDVEHDGYAVRARPPSLDDLLWLEQTTFDVDPRTVLLERCIITAHRDEELVHPSQLPMEVVDRISGALSNADPQADVQLALTCAACSHAWTALFDIVSFFWQELETLVWRLARDVDALAARYGWSEAEILAMNADRRALYLEVARE